MTQELYPVIRTVALHYRFTVKHDNATKKWSVHHRTDRNELYWDSTKSVEAFFEQLRAYFIEVGTSRCY